MKKVLIGLVVVVVLVIGYAVSVRNSLVVMNENVDGGWAQVEGQYQRRFDLIPNLVETVKGVAKQEVAVFTAIAEARTRYSGATSVSDKVAATNQMESALARLLVVVENYPELKSQQNFLALQSQIEGTENRISVERGRFNDLVRAFNTKVKVFPANIVASIFGLGEREYFEAATGAEQAPEVNF